MNSGFYPALGTPTGVGGTLVKDSFNRQVELMDRGGGARGFVHGIDGEMETIRNKEYLIAKQCRDVVNNRIPVLVGVMDCSIDRVLDRIDALESIKLDGVVTTTLFTTRWIPGILLFFQNTSKFPLPGLHLRFTFRDPNPNHDTYPKELIKETNITGYKTGEPEFNPRIVPG